MKNKLWKRGCCGLLSLALILSMIPVGAMPVAAREEAVSAPQAGAVSAAVAETPAAAPVSAAAEHSFALSQQALALGANVISKELKDNSTFMSNYVFTDGNSMNLNSRFKRTAYNRVSGAAETLSTGTMKRGNDGGQWYAQYTWTLTDREKALLKDSAYSLNFQANLTSDKHKVWTQTHASTTLSRLADKAWEVTTSEKAYNRNFTMYWSQSSKYNTDDTTTITKSIDSIDASGTGTLVYGVQDMGYCGCADTKTGGTVFYFVDQISPVLENVYIAQNADGSGAYYRYSDISFDGKSAITAYVVMEFSENVRLSDNYADGKSMQLKLDTWYGSQSGYTADSSLAQNHSITADLTSVSGNQMIFEFSVPATMGGKNTHVYITGLSPKQDFATGSHALKIYKGDGSEFVTSTRLTTSCRITDLAGNPLNWGYADKEIGTITFDNVAPVMDEINMTGSMITSDSGREPTSWEDNEADRSSIFAGVGDWVGFQVYFTESISNASNLTAVLSITGADGNPIRLGVKRVSGNCVTFQDLTITQEMLTAANRITITRIEGGENITDYAGNACTSSFNPVNIPPKQHIYLDVDAPVITIDAPIGDSAGKNYFSIPFKITENKSASLYSTINETPLAFSLELTAGTNRGFAWYVDTNQTIHTGEEWKNGTTGTTRHMVEEPKLSDDQLYYLHIRLDPSENYGYTYDGGMDENGVFFNGTFTVYAEDWAGNTAASAPLGIHHQVDGEAPKGEFTSGMTMNVDFDNAKAVFSADILLKDTYSLETATYTWYYKMDGQTGFTAQTPVTQTIAQSNSIQYKEFSKTLTDEHVFDKNTNEGRKGQVYVEVTFTDRAGQTNTIRSTPFSFNLIKASGHYTVTTGSQDAPILTPSVVISEPTWPADAVMTNAPRTLMIIPDPDNANGYWLYDPWDWTSDYDASLPSGTMGTGELKYTSEDLIGKLISFYEEVYPELGTDEFLIFNDYMPGRFYYMTGTVDVENHSGTFTRANTCDGPDACMGLYDLIKSRYGSLEILLVTTSSLEYWLDDYSDVSPAAFGDDFNFISAESTVESFTVYMINDTAYQVETMSVTDGQGKDASAILEYVKGNVPARNLDNTAIRFQVSNTSDAGADVKYGLNTIDFANSKVELLYYGSWKDNQNGTVLRTWELAQTSDGIQTVVLEPGLCANSGWYGLRVTVMDDITDTPQVFSLNRYFMDATVLDLTLDTYIRDYNTDRDVSLKNYLKVEKTGIESAYLENPTDIILGLDDAPEGWSVETYLEFNRTHRTDSASVQELAKIRVRNLTYNAQAGLPEDTGLWVDAASATSFRYVPVLTDLTAAAPYGTADSLKLPMVAGYNTLCYEIVSTNGAVVTKQIPVYVYPEAQEWILDDQRTYNGEYLQKVDVTAAPAVPGAFTLEECKFSYEEHYTFTANHIYTFTDEVDVTFFLMDPYGNLSTKKLRIEDADGNLVDIDGIPSEVSVHTMQGTDVGYENGDTFCIVVHVWDREREISLDGLELSFDSYYASVLGRESIPIPFAVDKNGEPLRNADGTYPIWEEYSTAHYGIYRTQILQIGGEEEYTGYLSFLVWGTWKYNPELETDENAPADRTLTVSSTDPYGNVGSASKTYGNYNPYLSLAPGTPVEIMSDVYDPYGNYADRDAFKGELNIDAPLTMDDVLSIYCNVPLASIESYGAGAVKQYQTCGQGQRVFSTTAPMIVEDGTYSFHVVDLFGQEYDLELNLYDVFGRLGINVAYSTVDPTNQDVTVTATSTGEHDEITSITSSLGTRGTIDAEDPRKASITVSENCTITIKTENGKTRTVQVSNIDKTLGKAYVVFLDEQLNRMSENETTAHQEVTAQLMCDSEPVYAINGPDSYAFPMGSKAGDTYTFEYSDAAGNVGTVTAVLPCDILPPPEVDEEAPEIHMTVLAQRDRTYTRLAELSNPSDGQSISQGIASFRAKQYRMVFTIDDASDTKVVVLPAGAEAPTDYASVENGSTAQGVELSVSGRTATLTITENTHFDIYFIDANNNIRPLTNILISTVDGEAPVLAVRYDTGTDENGYLVIIATFEPQLFAEKLETIIPITEPMLSKQEQIQTGVDEYGDPVYQTVTRYYVVFSDNGSFTFSYRDAFGNIGQAVATVKGMNHAAAQVQAALWYGTAGNVTPDKSATVNRDVTVKLEMSKAISAVTLLDASGEALDESTPVRVSFTGTNIYVTYPENVAESIVVEFTAAQNGRRGRYTLMPVTCIDKTPPTVTVKKTALAEDKRSMTITFETSEDTLLAQNAGEGYTTTHVWIARDNRSRSLQFTDRAGNVTVYQVTENASVDTVYLSARFSASADGSDDTDEPMNLELDSGGTFYIRVNKPAKAVLGGAPAGNLAKDTWTALTLPDQAGVHMLILTDINTGEETLVLVAAQPKDTVAPVINLASETVIINESVAVEEMLTAVRGGVTVTDDKDGEITDYTVSGYPDTVKAGLYTLTYTAVDAAGNTTRDYRLLYIMKEGTPLLKVNGEAAVPYGKVAIASGENIRLELDGFGADTDQVIIKYRDGIRTGGQMKYSSIIVENMTFSVPQPGHYTIYLRTQDRIEYVTYIYVEG